MERGVLFVVTIFGHAKIVTGSLCTELMRKQDSQKASQQWHKAKQAC